MWVAKRVVVAGKDLRDNFERLRDHMLDTMENPATLRELDESTAAFFCKAPDNNVLEFAM